MVQHIAVAKDILSIAQVHSPTVALPKKNYATMLGRKRKWNMLNGDDVGSNFSTAEFEQHVKDCAAILKLCTTDAANTNGCITRVEQDMAKDENDARLKKV